MSAARGGSARKRVVVVGAGLGGLSAACHLVGRGYDVLVVERGDQPGGRAARVTRNGFVFDLGPTVLTMPGLVDEVVRAAGSTLEDLLTIHRVDPAYRATFADGSVINVRASRDAMLEEIRTACGPREALAFERFASWLEELYRLEMPTFIERNYDRPWDVARPLRPGLDLLRMGALRSLHAKLTSFFDDERLHRLFGFQAMYAGLAPHQARAVFAVITYMDCLAGVFTVEGGIGAVPAALAAAAEKGGAAFSYGTEITEVVRASGSTGAVQGVRTADGEVITADAVVLNADLPVAWRLLPGLTPPRRLTKPRYSPSAYVWHLGVRGQPPPGTAHHNIHFGEQWRESFDAILRDGRRMPDPSILVSVPTVSHPELAPEEGSVLYVLEPVPNLEHPLDWSTERATTRARLLEMLVARGYVGGEGDIVAEEIWDPADWQRSGLAAGTPFALAHTFLQSGPFRPNNVDKRVPGLVFVGSGTVPGVGVPMVLVSGRLAADRVDELS